MTTFNMYIYIYKQIVITQKAKKQNKIKYNNK